MLRSYSAVRGSHFLAFGAQAAVWTLALFVGTACGNTGNNPNAGEGGGAGDATAGGAGRSGGAAGGSGTSDGGDAGSNLGGSGNGGVEPLDHSLLAVGIEFGCALNRQKSIECWGTPGKDLGQTSFPTGSYQDVRADGASACAIKSDASFECWGEQVGVASGTDAVDVAIGGLHACVLKKGGSIVCHGTAGNPEVGTEAGPFSRVGAGSAISCGLGEDGKVECWGIASSSVVSRVPDGRFSHLVVGAHHACAIDSNDLSVACWGAGDADDPNGSDPDLEAYGQAIPPSGRFIALAAGLAHNCGVLENGAVKCWGAGTTDDDCTPATMNCGQAMPPDGEFVQLAAGASHTCGLKDDGSITCWGSSTGGRSTPPADFRAF